MTVKEREEECYLPSLEEYTAPFEQAGFEVLRSEHFCWIPHSAGRLMTKLLRPLSPVLKHDCRLQGDAVIGRRKKAVAAVARSSATKN